jgi:hypothetical protein
MSSVRHFIYYLFINYNVIIISDFGMKPIRKDEDVDILKRTLSGRLQCNFLKPLCRKKVGKLNSNGLCFCFDC